MRVSPLLLALLALALVAPAADARPVDTSTAPVRQDLRSPDARDAASAGNSQTLQDLTRLHAGNPRTSTMSSPRYQGLLAQQRYYSSYGKPTPVPPRSAAPDDDSPWLTIGLGVGLIALVAGAVAFAVRTRRRTLRFHVA